MKKHAETHTAPLAAKGIHRHLLLAPDGVWAWYQMSDLPFAFKSAGERGVILNGATMRYADLAGHRIHLRRTNLPVDYAGWARALAGHAADANVAPGLRDYLLGAQNRIAAGRMEAPATYIGVRITETRYQPEHLGCILNPCDGKEPEKVTRAHQALLRVTRTVAKDGFGATPVNARVLGRLIQTSTALGHPAAVPALAGPADTWDDDDMDTFTSPVQVETAPRATTLAVHAIRGGESRTRHVAVLSVGRMNDNLDTEHPSFMPWLAAADQLPFPVEWTATFDVLDKKASLPHATYFRRRAETMHEHYLEHKQTPLPAVARGITDAIRVEDEISEGTPEVAVRLAGTIRCAVTGGTHQEAVDRAAALTDHYARNLGVALHHTYGQYQLAREFIPGEPTQAAGFIRHMPAYYAATGVPNAHTRLGDGQGPYLGRSGHSPVFFDPTWGPRNRKSGLVLVAGGLGSGKSTLAGAIAEPEVRRGHQVVIFDPSGPLARLCDLPHLAGVSRHVELAGAEPGTLNPYWLIPPPNKADFAQEEDPDRAYDAAVRAADAERRDLIVDAFTMLLSEREAGSVRALKHAVNQVGGEYATNPWRVVRALEDTDNPTARAAAEQLRDAAQMKGARLIFPEDEHADVVRAHALGDALFTVITMRGIVTPPVGTSREHWTSDELLAVPVLHLAGRYAMRAMYANTRPKTILTDETGIIAAGASTFRAFLTRAMRDSRKSNTCVGILSQNPADLLELAPQVTNLVGAAFVGRLGDPDTAAAALSILGVPDQHGYEKVLTSLETGQFLMRDYTGAVGQVDVDLGWRPDLLDALNTTPTGSVPLQAKEPSWTDELVHA